MTSPTRWTASAVVSWTPILTFTRRRLAVLDWFEANLKPVAFTDNPDHAGIAVGSHAQRLRFDRQSLTVATEDPSASVEPLEPGIQGVWDIIEPRNAVLERYLGAWSVGLDSDYQTARRSLAQRAVGTDFGGSVEAFDAACLIDFSTPLGIFQVEFGVVTAEELSERLQRPSVGMLRTSAKERRPQEVPPGLLDPVSVFFDVKSRLTARQAAAADVSATYRAAEKTVRELVFAVGKTL